MIRYIALISLLVALLGCQNSGIYRVLQQSETTGVAVSTESLISVIHPPHVGQELRVFVRHNWVSVKVTKVGPQGIVELRGIDGPLDLQPGDSGSPVAIIIGKRK